MGNIAIKGIADAIRESCPSDAVAMRYGGDEFVTILPNLLMIISMRLMKKCMRIRRHAGWSVSNLMCTVLKDRYR